MSVRQRRGASKFCNRQDSARKRGEQGNTSRSIPKYTFKSFLLPFSYISIRRIEVYISVMHRSAMYSSSQIIKAINLHLFLSKYMPQPLHHRPGLRSQVHNLFLLVNPLNLSRNTFLVHYNIFKTLRNLQAY